MEVTMRYALLSAALLAACSSSSSTGNSGADGASGAPQDMSAGVGDGPGAVALDGGGMSELGMEGVDAGQLDANVDGASGDLEIAPPDLQPEPFRDRIFAATSYNDATEPVFEITGGNVKNFATVPAEGWLGPLVITSEGRFFIASNAQGGSVWDITHGGDFTVGGAQPLVAGIFANNLNYIDGMASDTTGHLYVANSEHGPQPMAQVDVATKQVTMFGMYDNAEGVLVVGGTLYVAEGGKGRVVARDLASGVEHDFATGFEPGQDHISAQLAVDFAGHVYVNWQATGQSTHGLYDISGGGDFTGKPPIIEQTFTVDVNQIAFSSTGDCYMAGASTGNNYVAKRVSGVLQPFAVFVMGVGDNETMAIGH